jgi:hypothetical protein
VFCPSALLASDNLIVNGGFEEPVPVTKPELYYSGQNMGGWLVGGPDRVGLWWDPDNAVEGRQYLDMTRGDTISQVINLRPGRDYSLHFYVFASTDQAQIPQSFKVDVFTQYPADTLANNRVIASPVFAVTYISSSSTGGFKNKWTGYSVDFTAQSRQERFFFRHSTSSDYQWFLVDDISLVELPVPEPSSLTIVGLAIVGFMGVSVNRKQRRRHSCNRVALSC